MTGQGIRAVWTDFGGVLTPPVSDSIPAFCARLGVPQPVWESAVARVTAGYGVRDPMQPLDTPLVTEDRWARQVERVLAAEFALTVDLGDPGAVWFQDRPVNRDWLAYLAELRRAGVFIGLLSNMPPSWDRHWQAMVPAGFFDGVVLSHRAGFRKPAPEIFELAAADCGFAPAENVLVDDLPHNCAGARAAGWQAVRFTEAPDVIAALSAWTGVEQAHKSPTGEEIR